MTQGREPKGQLSQTLLVYPKNRKGAKRLLRELLEDKIGLTLDSFWKELDWVAWNRWELLKPGWSRSWLGTCRYQSQNLLVLEIAWNTSFGDPETHLTLECHKPLRAGDPTFIWAWGLEELGQAQAQSQVQPSAKEPLQ